MIKLSDFQIGRGITQVNLDNLGFNPIDTNFIHGAINQINKQYQDAKELNIMLDKPPVGVVPHSAFPIIEKAFSRFNKKATGDFILYYQHNPIGFIRADKPVDLFVCPECMSEIVDGKCPKHGEVEPEIMSI